MKTRWLAFLPICPVLVGLFAGSIASGQPGDIDLRTDFNHAYARYEAALSAAEFESAAALAEHALELGRQLFGEFDLNTVSLRQNHALTLQLLGFVDEAEAEYLAALDILDALDKADSLEAVPILTQLGGLYEGGQTQAELLQRALAIHRAEAPYAVLPYASLAVEVADLLTRTSYGRPLAREILRPVLDELEDLYGEDSPNLVPVLIALGKADAQFGNDDLQFQWVERAIEIIEENYQDDDAVRAVYALEVGRDLLYMSRSPRSEPFLEHALSYYDEALGAGNQRTAEAAILLGEARFQGNSYTSAERPLLDALQFFTGKERFQAQEIRIRTMLVEIYSRTNEPDEATPHLIELGRLSGMSRSFEYLPVFQIEPDYPTRAAAERIEGHVIVQYKVTTTGQTDDITVIESTNNMFDRPAIASVRRYRYIPQIDDGEFIEVPEITTRIDFDLDLE